MNCRISESSLRAVCRELLRTDVKMTHRVLRATLRERFGASGKTSRVLAIWREEAQRISSPGAGEAHQPHLALPADIRELQARLEQAEAIALEMKTRAELAELREQSHQERWALQIDGLRQQLRLQPDYGRQIRALQTRVALLTAQLAALRTGAGEEGDDR